MSREKKISEKISEKTSEKIIKISRNWIKTKPTYTFVPFYPEIWKESARKVLRGTKDIDPKYEQLINENFWDLM